VTLGLQAATPDKPRYVPLIARQTLPGFHRWIEQEQSESRGQVLLCASGWPVRLRVWRDRSETSLPVPSNRSPAAPQRRSPGRPVRGANGSVGFAAALSGGVEVLIGYCPARGNGLEGW